ncbi:hypothetical protein HGP17_28925 [Rhizobium sp. P38BS-XIX]|uniref:hypothetical protein n=1 Tax=Rhizobium sp. P38BS-XIX TaxID=2726740 RepID=UPI001456E4CC|nr:hypothetical protein [Rhizobium sp. P38BS-XIX]NLS00872.1 hypothetical protein [Rhizobium sp. P38BS-XIX]
MKKAISILACAALASCHGLKPAPETPPSAVRVLTQEEITAVQNGFQKSLALKQVVVNGGKARTSADGATYACGTANIGKDNPNAPFIGTLVQSQFGGQNVTIFNLMSYGQSEDLSAQVRDRCKANGIDG